MKLVGKLCLYCGEPFSGRKDRKACSKSCSSRLSYLKKERITGVRKPRIITYDDGDLRKCKVCQKWKSKETEFSSKYFEGAGIVTKRTCKICRKEGEKGKLRLEDKNTLYNDVKNYVLRIKAQNYNCYSIDVWRLIDLYDRVFPSQLNIPHTLYNGKGTDMEMSSIVMFEKVARWYVDERDHLELTGVLR
jgi:hypothetical protein